MPRAIRVVLAVLACALLQGPASAAPPTLSLPVQLPPEERARLEAIARGAFASTRMEYEPYAVRPEIFEYLLDHPEFASHVSRALRAARLRVWHDASGLWLDDGWGTRGQFWIVYAERGMRLMYAEGAYRSKLLPDVGGQAVVRFDYGYRPAGTGHTVVVTGVMAFVQVESGFIRTVGKLATAFVQAKADREARRMLRVFAKVINAIETDPAELYRRLSERPDVPHRELEEFRQLLRLPETRG